MYLSDTICAPATAAGDAGIAIIRISGKDALFSARKVFFSKTEDFEPRKMYLGELRYNDELIDTALFVYFKAPYSYTGEDVCELHVHGGRIAVKLALSALLENGVRLAEPGEFSKRAFINGKMDITQAEAVQEMITALSEKGAKMSAKRLRGDLREKIDSLKDKLTDVIASIEAGIEYPEEEEEISQAMATLPDIKTVLTEAKKLESTYERGRLIREGMEIAIAGRPNVGKSSLLNAILGEDRAIVTSVPGTTRDPISEYYDLRSVPVRFTDTAGIRSSDDVVEKIGVERSKNAVDNAFLVLFLIDASQGISDEDRELFKLIKDKQHFIVLNKTDIAAVSKESIEKEFSESVSVISAKTREGIESLLDRIFELASCGEQLYEGVTITNLRQKTAVSNAVRALSDAYDALKAGVDLDCVSIDLSEAWRSLCEITGEALTEDIVDRIFEKFCLGK